jgi:sugar phosphate isomerase/epimerase
MKRCNITAHAIEQFIRRWAPDAKPWQAEKEIESLFSTSKKMGITPLGDTIVASSHRPEVRLVIKDRDVVITVLPPGENMEPNEDEKEEMCAAYERQQRTIRDVIETYEKEVVVLDRSLAHLAEKKKLLDENRSSILNKIRDLRKQLEKWT